MWLDDINGTALNNRDVYGVWQELSVLGEIHRDWVT